MYTKWEIKVKENSEVAAIGDQIVKLIAAEAKNQDQKIMLLRYLKEVVFDNNKTGNPNSSKSDEDRNLTAERKNELLKMVEDSFEKKNNENKN